MMGRTRRKRVAKKGKVDSSGSAVCPTRAKINLNKDIISLVIWMNSVGCWLKWSSVSDCPRLQLTDFVGWTGRGLMATEDIARDRPLVSVPFCLVICRSTALSALKNHNILPEFTRKLTTHELLAAFVMIERHSSSSWKPYLESLPRTFDVPYFCTAEEVQLIATPYLKQAMLKQRSELAASFKRVAVALANSSPGWQPPGEGWSLQGFAEAYFVVNTRAVYFEQETPARNWGSGRPSQDNLALVPFLDMFNHSSEARVEAGTALVSRKGPSGCRNSDDGVQSYQLVTKKPVKKGDQVFINYGAHSNLKLYVEYGFVIPGSSDDFVPIALEDLEGAAKAAGREWERVRLEDYSATVCFALDIVKDNRLSENMRVDCDGNVSWNVGAAFFIVVHFLEGKPANSWRGVFSRPDFSGSQTIARLVSHLLKRKLDEVDRSREALQAVQSDSGLSSSGHVALALLTCHSHVLKVAIELQSQQAGFNRTSP